MDDSKGSRFWDKYIEISKRYKVRDNALRWYVRHAENYLKAYKDEPLSSHTAAYLESYLREKGRNPNLRRWQYLQILHALEILFVEMADVAWAENYPWQEWIATADTLPDDHVTLDRAYHPQEPFRNLRETLLRTIWKADWQNEYIVSIRITSKQ